MYAARAAKPKLSLSIAAATTNNTSRPALSLKSPTAMSMPPRTPLSPSPLSPTALNTKLNQRGFSTVQQATFAYANPASSKSILKKNSSNSPSSGASSKRIQFSVEPIVHCVTPIEYTDDYYGGYVKMSRDERRWLLRSDDTSVAIVEKHGSSSPPRSTLHFLENITADSRQYQGIHPVVALESHQETTAKLINKALAHLPPAESTGDLKDVGRLINLSPSPFTTSRDAATSTAPQTLRRKPDFISVTRGPGMRSNLFNGLDTAKGLAVAWQIPIVGVHHMQAHLLTPRLFASLQHQSSGAGTNTANPNFPFISLLVSGGHTLLVHSNSIVDHQILASTCDIAIGDALDKVARAILPQSYLDQSNSTMYGKLLESFAFPNGASDFAEYQAPRSRAEELKKQENEQWGWSFGLPYAESRKLEFSFSGMASQAERIVAGRKSQWEALGKSGEGFMSNDERIALAHTFMRCCFEHLASRTIIALQMLRQRRKDETSQESEDIPHLVISGGVGANQFLRKLLRSFLDIRGFGHIDVIAPPPYLCTDNAAMIGWAGIEMFEAGWRSNLECRAIRKWSLDPKAEDGGILGADGWIKFS
ncbi:hypothetical protein AJ79_01276 [Helicocarpus griseus UAMH5409]|uniref:N(6)-L-threonylcarbamoyladenine synthase n=1 Tax=Helicocarpus griseus UAMH5409 TaxID=1447875 RepID=A0A2B7Y887_9EURO|nr:hypothetical protein AJ79_01276 [Helicocarpus griseus UAMH5409]